jgi:hypothetical protein
MLARFRQTAAGLQCSLVETRRIDGKVRHEIVANLGSVPASPSVADRIAFWRRVYETLAELANRIDAETQGKIISAVHSHIAIVTPDEQRATRVSLLPRGPRKAPRDDGVNECPRSEAEVADAVGKAELTKEPITQGEHRENLESGRGGPMTAEEFRTILVHLLHHTPFR